MEKNRERKGALHGHTGISIRGQHPFQHLSRLEHTTWTDCCLGPTKPTFADATNFSPSLSHSDFPTWAWDLPLGWNRNNCLTQNAQVPGWAFSFWRISTAKTKVDRAITLWNIQRRSTGLRHHKHSNFSMIRLAIWWRKRRSILFVIWVNYSSPIITTLLKLLVGVYKPRVKAKG